MNRALITLGFCLSLGTVLVARACPPITPIAEGSLLFVEAASPRVTVTAISIL
jgi:hypothetical protein